MSKHKRKINEIIGNIVQDIRSEKVFYFDSKKKSDRIGFVFQLVMSKGILSIENPFSVLINKKILSSDSLDIFDNLKNLIGAEVEDAWVESDLINIKFIIKDAELKISLKEEDFISPEAGDYTPYNGDIIVFD